VASPLRAISSSSRVIDYDEKETPGARVRAFLFSWPAFLARLFGPPFWPGSPLAEFPEIVASRLAAVSSGPQAVCLRGRKPRDGTQSTGTRSGDISLP